MRKLLVGLHHPRIEYGDHTGEPTIKVQNALNEKNEVVLHLG